MRIHKQNCWRYAILEHTVQNQIHWDFLFEREFGGSLLTWSFTTPPWENDWAEVTRLPDHRAIYLQYEGVIAPRKDDPLRRSRGSVRRVRSGFFTRLPEPPKLTLSPGMLRLSESCKPPALPAALPVITAKKSSVTESKSFVPKELAREDAAVEREYRFCVSDFTVDFTDVTTVLTSDSGNVMNSDDVLEWRKMMERKQVRTCEVRLTLLDAATSRWVYRRIPFAM